MAMENILTTAVQFIQAIFFFAGLIYLSHRVSEYCSCRFGQIDPDETGLSNLALSKSCSVYNIFCISGKTWNITDGRINADFKEYIWFGNIPYYVKDFLRKNSTIPVTV